MKLRLKNHEDRNAARKKTDEEKREKKIAKLGKKMSYCLAKHRLLAKMEDGKSSP